MAVITPQGRYQRNKAAKEMERAAISAKQINEQLVITVEQLAKTSQKRVRAMDDANVLARFSIPLDSVKDDGDRLQLADVNSKWRAHHHHSCCDATASRPPRKRRCRVQLQTLSHVLEAVHACLDRFVCFASVSNAVLLNSVDLLRRVASHEHEHWKAAAKSAWRINSYKMTQFALAMEIVTANGGLLHVAQWLFEEYASNCSVNTELLFETAACAGHAAVLTWLTENIRLWKRLDGQVLYVVVEKGHLDVLEWWLKHNNPNAFTSLEVEFAAGEGRLEALQFMYERAADPSRPCTIRAMENARANGHLGIVQ